VVDDTQQFNEGAKALTALLADYDRVILVANNPDLALSPAAVDAERTLHVFVNKAVPLAKVSQFDQDCAVFSGMTQSIIFAVEGKQIPALQNIKPGRCKAVGVLISRDYAGRPQLNNWDGNWIELRKGPWAYPAPLNASTGFTILHFLVHCAGQRPITLLGFTGRTSTKRKLSHRHDWVYEQLYIRLLAESGRIALHGSETDRESDKIELLRRAFPDMRDEQFSKVIDSYMTEELGSVKGAIHGVVKILRPITFLKKSLHFG